MKSYDIIILGAGPAGLTAGIYAARAGLKTAIVSKDVGGTANSIVKLENWPGFHGSGMELMKKIYEHLKEYKVDVIISEVEKIEKEKNKFVVHSKKEELESKAIIITTGKARKKLNVPGEEKLLGRGVSYCVMCDGFFFKDKTVALVGENSEDRKVLSKIVKKIYDIKSKELKEIMGKEKVEKIVLNVNGKEKILDVDGIFIEIGSVPLIEFAKNLNLKLDKENDVVVDEEMKTSVPGIFAAGDITNSKTKQVVVASSQGAIAVKSASEYLKK
jgi:thioredoxin reductase (NADPH)